MIYLLIAAILIGAGFALYNMKQDCLWCGKKERLHGRILCDFCTTLARR